MEKILQGIFIGVTSGIILSLFFWGRGYLEGHFERRDQIRYLANVITDFRDQIYGAETLEVTLGDQKQTVEKDNLRKVYFDDMRTQVESILQGRASRLSYDEINQVRRVFYTDLYPTLILNEKGYNKIFDEMESIEWLKLPERTPR